MSIFRPSKPLKNLCDLKCEIVRGSKKYVHNNNQLHNAILANDINKVNEILNKTHKHKLFSLFEKQSLLNTPLTLALKHGNIEIAKLLLKKMLEIFGIDPFLISIRDCQGLTALDWACILRNDDIIKLILKMGVSVDLDDDNFGDTFAHILYQSSIGSLDGFIQNISEHTSNARTPEEKNLIIASFFAENKGEPLPASHFLGCEPLSDTRYYMKDLCINLGILKKDALAEAEKQPVSHLQYYFAFMLGQEAFCKYRDAITPSPELLKALENNESLFSYLEQEEEREMKALGPKKLQKGPL